MKINRKVDFEKLKQTKQEKIRKEEGKSLFLKGNAVHVKMEENFSGKTST